MTIITIISHGPRREGLESTMAENSVQDSPQFDVRVEGQEMTFAEQASLLRAAADQLDPPAIETDPEV